jgi:glucosamine kinase
MLAARPSLQSELVPPAGGDPVMPVTDGLVGAAVLALRHAGLEVEDALFHTIQAEVARVSRPRSSD